MELEDDDDSIVAQPTSRHSASQDSVARAIRGMESVVATVSGYHGSERFDLIKLISQSGANYVGMMSRSITHLVCWKFEGKKFNLANKFKILIVSHRWFEDCVKAGRRIPEDPYVFKCGQEVGSLRLDGLLVAKKASPLTKKPRKVLLDLSIVDNGSEEPIINPKGGDSSRRIWSNSCLLNENLFPNNSFKSNRKAGKKPIEEEQSSTIRYCQEPSLSVNFRMEGGSSSSYATRSVRQKKDICNAVESTISAETSRKGRRLVKRNISRDILVQVLSDSEQVYNSAGTRNPHANIRPSSNCPDGGTIENLLMIDSENSAGELDDSGRNRVDSLEELIEVKDLNQTSSSGELNLCSDDVSADAEGISQDARSYAEESLSGGLKIDDQIESITRLPTSTELSCVICHTDFSSTRGVLPCGHRFCYPCIQNWADHLASMRKISTCPLCKASFASITKFDDADNSDQKIYSQTIPYASSTTDIFILPDQETSRIGAQFSVAPVCSGCQRRDPEDLLISCHVCQNRCIHSYCLDPPLLPWTCIHCKDLRMHYHHAR